MTDIRIYILQNKEEVIATIMACGCDYLYENLKRQGIDTSDKRKAQQALLEVVDTADLKTVKGLTEEKLKNNPECTKKPNFADVGERGKGLKTEVDYEKYTRGRWRTHITSWCGEKLHEFGKKP